MKKKIFLAVVAITIAIISVLSISSCIDLSAWMGLEETFSDDFLRGGLEYTLSDDGSYYFVSGIEYNSFNEYTVLDTYKGLPVKLIDSNAFENCNATKIVIPDSVETIGSFAFRDCKNLESITLGNGVTAIYNSAFSGCSSLTSITIPKSVTNIFWYAFSNCTSLTSVTIPRGVANIGWGAFSNCTSLTSITIPKSVTVIGKNAFESCTSLTSAYFEITTGWYVGKNFTLTNIYLSNGAAAAKDLVSTYVDFDWQRL